MPYLTFRTREEVPRVLVGRQQDDGIVTLGGHEQPHSLKQALVRGLDALDAWPDGDETFQPEDIDYLPPVLNPGKIFCIGLNYHAHRLETGNQEREHPTVFTRFATCLVGHREPVWRPRDSDQMDYEGELAVIIGRDAHRVRRDQAMSYVAGYSCFNDVSIRDWQRHTTQFTPGKNFMCTGAFGPALVTSREIPDPTQLSLTTRLNGEVMQQTTTDLMIFSIPELIEYLSTFTRLEVGDVIVTGTPGGVGVKREPPVFMKPGDRVEVDVSGVGVLCNPVIDEPC